MRETNPKHASAWIASARVEEVTGKYQQAQALIMKGCDMVPKSEDVWLESIRLMPPEQKKKICSMAIQNVPKSVKIWCKASDLEEENLAKRKVMRKALENIPNSVKLWKLAVDLEEPEDAQIMLTKAVECCPFSVELWLALAKLEKYENARKILNKARETIPTDRQIWITAAKLEETNQNSKFVPIIIERGLQSLQANSVEINKENWFDEAAIADLGGFELTANSIIENVAQICISEKDLKSVLLKDCDNVILFF